MRIYTAFTIFLLFSLVAACGSDSSPSTPSDTLVAYSNAIKKKDAKMIKFLLSKGSLEIHRGQAKAQNMSLDEIVLQETLFLIQQRNIKRNEKIEGDTATIEIKNSFDTWDTIFFVRENGVWKIDKKGFSDNTIKQNDADNQKLDDEMNESRKQNEDNLENSDTPNTTDESPSPTPSDEATPGNTPSDTQDDRVKPKPSVSDQS